MKHAILMTIYKDVSLVNRVIKSYPATFDIYVHIDKKSDITNNSVIRESGHLYVYKLYSINWGGVNHLLSFIHLLKMALINDNYDYYHLVTGQDVFIGTQKTLETFIEKYPINTSFVETFRIPCEKYTTWESGWGIFDYYRFSDIFSYNMKTTSGSRINAITLKLHRFFNIRRKRPNYPVYMGSLYGSLSGNSVMKMLKSSLFYELKKRLKYTLCGEGVFFQTLLMNLGCPVESRTLTYTDWLTSNEKPKILDETDYHKWGDDKFFIRKVDSEKSSELLSLLKL